MFQHWLGLGHRLRATAGSDIHGPEDGRGAMGFNHVEADSLTEFDILDAIRAGRNYLSSGPRLILTALTAEGQTVGMGNTVAKSAVFHVDYETGAQPLTLRLVDATGPRTDQSLGANSAGVARLDQASRFVMAELRNAAGGLHAVTNPIFID